MISSTNFFNRALFPLLILILLSAQGCAGRLESPRPLLNDRRPILVLPLDNLTGGKAPLKEMRQLLVQRLESYGLQVISDAKTEAFLARHRIRYTGGIDSSIAKSAGDEVGAAAVFVTSLELYDTNAVPKIALFSRLLSAGNNMRILWMDSVGLAGDDAPGLLKLGMIEDPLALREKALRDIADSLYVYLADRQDIPSGANGKAETGDEQEGKFKANATKGGRYSPKVQYQQSFPKKGGYRVAILPFHNETDRKGAGETMMLHFAKELAKKKDVEVIEPGVVRKQLLDLRMVISEGVTLADVDIIADRLDAEMILSGKCLTYEDYRDVEEVPQVMFSAFMIERQSRKMLWSSVSYNAGDNGVLFFDFGKIGTASSLASVMTGAVIAQMVQ